MKGSKILLVDDEKVFTDNMGRLLRARGYVVEGVNSGEDGIARLASADFDVVALDLKMPGLDGIGALRRIKDLGLFTQILILTGHGSIDTALEAVRLGAYDYLTKPCEIDELVDKIEGAWEKKDEAAREDLDDKIKKVIEDPHDAVRMFGKKK
jgi:DNA-binding NtrC family response regulator